jgi:hypothetical protein
MFYCVRLCPLWATVEVNSTRCESEKSVQIRKRISPSWNQVLKPLCETCMTRGRSIHMIV